MPEPIIDPIVNPANPENPNPNPEPSFLDTVPEEFRDRPWAKENATTPENFFKFVDNQSTLVGKKGVIIPEAGAPIEQVNEYLKSIGRPDSPDGYEFTPIEELKDSKRDAEFETATKKLLHEVGIPKDMGVKLQQGFDKLLYERTKTQVEANKAADAAFEKFNTEFFGDKKDTIVTNAQKILRENLAPEVLPVFDKMDSEQLAMVIAVTDGLYKKFGKEDGFRGGDPGGAPSGSESYEELSAQQRELMAKPGFDDWRHADHASLMEQNRALLEKMRAIKK